MARTNKHLYGWKLYVDYGQGWELNPTWEVEQKQLAAS